MNTKFSLTAQFHSLLCLCAAALLSTLLICCNDNAPTHQGQPNTPEDKDPNDKDPNDKDPNDKDPNDTCDSRSSAIEWHPCTNAGSPSTTKERWNHTRSAIIAALDAKHRGIDTIVNPGQDQTLIGKFVYGPLDKDLKREKVEVWIEVACGNWQLFGSANTTEDGDHPAVDGIKDDGGRIFFSIPAGKRLPIGSYRVKMIVKGDLTEANFWLHVWAPGTRVVISDIDGTITTRENDGAWTIFDPASPTPRAGSAATFHAYAAKGYRILYVTARPEFVLNGTRKWFANNGFPQGIFHLSEKDTGEIFGSGAQAYKSAYFKWLAQSRGLAIEWVYGNKESDLDAYLSAGVPADRIRLVAGEYAGDLKGSTMFSDYIPESERVACLPPL
ncbi:MAG: hypothetical protein FWC40_04280 [Proteobacteria bacterium]|nr:hypothetical protein [Pseudomonadota bacterium]